MLDTAETKAASLPAKGFISNYIFSRDHKVIGTQYYFLALFAALVGVILSLLMRVHLVWPAAKIPLLGRLFPNGAPDGVMTPELYLALMTMHGTIMVFFVLTTAIQNGFGNYFLPIQVGAEDMAFPTLNMLSFWTTFVSLAVLLSAIVAAGGGPISGWTAYAPLSALGEVAGPGLGLGQVLWLLSIALFCVASLLGALNFIVTTLDLRARGLSLMRLPLTVWGWLATAVMGLLAFAVLLSAGVLLLMDQVAGTSFFIPGGLVVSDQVIRRGGGSPVLWQHLLWFFGHPEVYIIIVPAIGVASHVLAVAARKPTFGYRAVVYALIGISALGFFVWGHHMFVSGMSPFSGSVFSALTIAISIPASVIAFSWLGTLWRGKIRFDTPSLFALGFVSLFVTGGIGGLFLGQTALDMYLHDTYFVVGHFHLIMGLAAIFGVFIGTYHWFPKMFGRMLNEKLGKAHFWLTFLGGYAIFVPMHFLGIAGHPRRYPDTTAFQFLAPLNSLHHFITWAATVTAAAQVIFLFNFFWSLWKGRPAESNPWQATTLEWTIPSPPPHDNFAGVHPTVYRGAYEYSVPGAEPDYIPQNAPAGNEPAGAG
ncbi:MAG: cbb3-type cytochrome c oxidase subunit I [Acidobacteria bacterium]|nr:cbb3-type cytochrome c oxidase subunit I [Acidobacteriota bacterium]